MREMESRFRAKSVAMATAVNTYMWDGTDHYVTQVGPADVRTPELTPLA